MKFIFNFTRALLRLVLSFIVITTYLIQGSFLYLIMHDPDLRRQKLILSVQKYCAYLLNIFSVKVICHHPLPQDEKSLLVGNHVGFVDILCLETLTPAVFITSKEMRRTPGLGQLCEVAGCVYVDRVNRMKIYHELKDLVSVLKKGFRVVLYAESVASNGEAVLPFKKTLMTAAGQAEVPIRPFVFNFRQVNGQAVTLKYRDSLCWYGDQSFAGSIWRLVQLDSVVCEIEFLPLVYPKPDDDRTELAQQLHQAVSSQYAGFQQATH